MYIDKVRLKNIRGFGELEFSFDRGNGRYAGWTVLTGNNGSGKSTLLRAIAMALMGRDVAISLEPGYARWLQSPPTQGVISIEIIRSTEDPLPAKQTWPATGLQIDLLFTSLNDGQALFVARDVYDMSSAGRQQFDITQKTIWSSTSKGWFSCGYGPFRRVFGPSEDMVKPMMAPISERFITMFQESAALSAADQWLRALNYKKLEGKQREAATLETVLAIFCDEFLPNQITVDRVDSDGLWLKDRNGLQLSWRDMSDGYRSALALLADILRHIINAYGEEGLTDRDAEGRLFVTRSGVVLIDEVDAHLHPEWQREIGFWLKRHFPNIQFIVTSHSPLICQAADPNGLFILPEPGSDEPARALTPEEYQEVISSRPDTILRSAAFGLQNTRSPLAVEARSAYADLRTKQRAGGKLTKIELAELERLRQYINPDEEA